MPEYVIEDFYSTEYGKRYFKLKYGGYSMIISNCDGNAYMLSIQSAMNRLKTAYDTNGAYLPPQYKTFKESAKIGSEINI